MGEQANILKNSDLESIDLWIKGIEKKKYQDSTKQFEDFFREKSNLKLPYTMISYGMSRAVFDLNNGHVLKIAITVEGIKCNEIEAEIYKVVPSSLKKYLADVKDHGYGWIIMKKMDNKIPDTEENRKKVLHIRKKFRKYGIKANDIVDWKKKAKWKNLGLNEEGKITVTDYGHFKIMDSQAENDSKQG